MPDEIATARGIDVLGDNLDSWCRSSERRQFSEGSDDSGCNRPGAAGADYLCQTLDVTNARHGSSTFEAEGEVSVIILLVHLESSRTAHFYYFCNFWVAYLDADANAECKSAW